MLERVVDDKPNFSQISALIVDSDHYSTSILSQMLRGFGLTRLTIAQNGEEAKSLLLAGAYDLVISECVLPDMQAAEFIRWIRRLDNTHVKYTPVVMLTGYAQLSNVTAARDSGANSVVRKPVSPAVLFDHISWSAKSERPFVEVGGYVGPCRRFKFGGSGGSLARRETDRDIDTPGEPRMSLEHADKSTQQEKVSVQ